MDLREFLLVIWRWKLVVLAVVLVSCLVLVFYGVKEPAVYSAETTLIVGLDEISVLSPNSVAVVQSGEQFGSTFGEMIQSKKVLQRAAEISSVHQSESELRGKINTEVVLKTPALTLSFMDSDPDKAIEGANSVSQAFIEYLGGVGAATVEKNQLALEEALVVIETKLAEEAGKPAPDFARVAALEGQRDILLNEFKETVGEKVSAGDVSVSLPAETASRVSSGWATRLGITFLIGLVSGVAVAFIGEGIRRAFALRPKQDITEMGNPGQPMYHGELTHPGKYPE